MKKNILILTFCTLISAGIFQAPSYAMEKEQSIPADILEDGKKKCYVILTDLKPMLELWQTHRYQSLKLKTLPFKAPFFAEIRKSVESVKMMDELHPQIKEKSTNLLDILVNLQEAYNLHKDLIDLMGLQNEWNAIANNMDIYMAHYTPKGSETSTAGNS